MHAGAAIREAGRDRGGKRSRGDAGGASVDGRGAAALLAGGASRFAEPDRTELRWTIARVPAGVVEGWTQTRRLRVRGEIHGGRIPDVAVSDAGRELGVHAANQQADSEGGRVRVHDEVEIGLEPDLEERPSALPAELIAAFEGDRALR